MSNKRFVLLFDIARAHANAKLQCRSCPYSRVVTSDELFQILPMTMRIDHAGARLRCGECGKRGADIIAIPVGARDTWHRLSETETRLLLKVGLQQLPDSVIGAIENGAPLGASVYDLGSRRMVEHLQMTGHDIYRT